MVQLNESQYAVNKEGKMMTIKGTTLKKFSL